MPPFSLVLYQSASRQTTARRLSTTLPLRQSLFTHSRKPLLQIHSQFIPRNWLCFCWFHLANGPCINLPFKRSYNFYFTIILFNKYLLVGPLRVEMLFSFSERETALFLVNIVGEIRPLYQICSRFPFIPFTGFTVCSWSHLGFLGNDITEVH